MMNLPAPSSPECPGARAKPRVDKRIVARQGGIAASALSVNDCQSRNAVLHRGAQTTKAAIAAAANNAVVILVMVRSPFFGQSPGKYLRSLTGKQPKSPEEKT